MSHFHIFTGIYIYIYSRFCCSALPDPETALGTRHRIRSTLQKRYMVESRTSFEIRIAKNDTCVIILLTLPPPSPSEHIHSFGAISVVQNRSRCTKGAKMKHHPSEERHSQRVTLSERAYSRKYDVCGIHMDPITVHYTTTCHLCCELSGNLNPRTYTHTQTIIFEWANQISARLSTMMMCRWRDRQRSNSREVRRKLSSFI